MYKALVYIQIINDLSLLCIELFLRKIQAFFDGTVYILPNNLFLLKTYKYDFICKKTIFRYKQNSSYWTKL